MAPLTKAQVKAGARFTREVKGVTHEVTVVKTKDGLRFRDGAGVEHQTFSGAAKAASGWASCNPLHFYRLEGATNGKTPAKTTRKAKGVADTIQATAEPVMAVAPTVEAVADVVFPGLNEAVAEQAAQPARRGRRMAGSQDTTAKPSGRATRKVK